MTSITCTNEALLRAMQETALECGKILLAYQPDKLEPRAKTSSRDVVTHYDTLVQDRVIAKLSKMFPEAEFLSEESINYPAPDAPLVFVIDPIDGTMNFVKGLQHSCVSIACFRNGCPTVGVVYDPYQDELFYASAGTGAWLNGAPIRTTTSHLSDTLTLFGTSPYNPEKLDETFDMLKSIYGKCLDLRRMGSAALDICYVACGRAGLYFESRLSLWDYAAAAMILSEAGGCIYDYHGKALPFGTAKTSVIVGTADIISESKLLMREE